MSEITAAEAVDRLGQPVQEIGRAWMRDARTVARGEELGLDPEIAFDFWVNGRAGVLGDGDAAKAVAGIAFMGPAMVRHFWEQRPHSLGAEEAAAQYAEAGAAWGRQSFTHVPLAELSEIAELSTMVTSAVPDSIGVLFAGWRQLDLPPDPAGAATVALNVLRELRGGAHILAVYASGLDPVTAILSVDHPTHGGPSRAERFGWTPPFAEPNFVAREAAEALTSKILEPIFEKSLTGTARARLVELVEKAHEVMDA
jgi:hypothetical protein